MQHCAASAPVHPCSPASLSASAKYAAVELLNKQRLYFVVEVKSRAKELYKQTCAHLSSQGMLDTELFGLAIVVDGEFLFVDPDSKLSKYAPKHWKSSHGHGLDGNGRPSLVLYFRVQFYVDSPLLLRDETTRHHYYLQLRHNVVSRGLLHACASEELLYLLAGLALQADLGDYNPQQHTGVYFSPAEYFPKQMVENSEQQLVQTVPTLHRDNRGMGRARAELLYIREASSTEVSPLTHNSHLYRLRYKKNEQGPGTVWLAITAKGIQIYEEISAKTLTATFLWNNIGKLCFDRKKFEIRALNWPTSGEKFTYYTSSDEKSKHLLFLCRTTHQFSMAIQPRLSEVRRKEEEERKRFRDWVSAGTCKADQRTSVISNTSSNTTSGIVSDRVHSLDESEDELEGEIMITSPPAPLLTPAAPPSVESLALAHLRDDDSEAAPSPPPRGSSEDMDQSGMGSGLVHGHQKTSPNSSGGGGAGGAATPATTDGSQCSSSCSTVVVAGPAPPTRPRRASTSSSLELGFSHTAQNSAVSEPATSVGGVLPAPSTLTSGTTTVALDYSVRSAHTSSGVYTLTTSAGSRPGTPDSCVSAASFRGDGSDPPAAPPRSPLSAAELSHLIVSGRPALDDAPTVDASESFTVLDTPEVPPPVPPLPPPDPAPPPLPLPAEPMPGLPGSGEVTARLVTTRPHISVLTAHTSVAPPAAAPSYAAPTHTASCHRIVDKMKVQAAQQLQVHLQQQQQQQQMVPVQLTVGRNNYLDVHASRANASAGLIHASLSRSTLALSGCASSPSPGSSFSATGSAALLRSTVATAATSPGSSYSGGSSSRCQYTSGLAGLPLGQEHRGFSMGGRIGYLGGSTGALHRAAAATGLSFSATGSAGSCGRLPPPPPHLHARRFSPPPPPLHPRQPPPPPPPPSSSSLATVYTSQVTRGQIEQFRQQMFSDVDYVIYPMCDPALSRQEYADAKAASTLSLLSLSSASASASRQAGAAPPPPPPYAWSSGLPGSGQGLRRGFPAYSCSTESLLGPPTLSRPIHQSAARYQYAPSSHRGLGGDILRGARSHEDLLGCSTGISAICAPHTYDRPVPAPPPVTHGYRRLPPPPPPPPYDQQISVPVTTPEKQSCPAVPESQRDAEPQGVLDIRTLREKSKNLDLPLISALCNDRSLLEQTNAFVMPRHPRRRQPSRSSEGTTEPASVEIPSSSGGSGSVSRKLSGVSGGTLLSGLGTSKLKYPVSGLSTTQISKPRRKASSGTHVHTHPCSSVSASPGAIKNEGRNVGRRDTIMP